MGSPLAHAQGEKHILDVWYVDHQSLWLDVKILVMTMWHVFKREGISHPGEATMTEFLGYHPNLSGTAGI